MGRGARGEGRTATPAAVVAMRRLRRSGLRSTALGPSTVSAKTSIAGSAKVPPPPSSSA